MVLRTVTYLYIALKRVQDNNKHHERFFPVGGSGTGVVAV
jgi:hypothetical protein